MSIHKLQISSQISLTRQFLLRVTLHPFLFMLLLFCSSAFQCANLFIRFCDATKFIELSPPRIIHSHMDYKRGLHVWGKSDLVLYKESKVMMIHLSIYLCQKNHKRKLQTWIHFLLCLCRHNICRIWHFLWSIILLYGTSCFWHCIEQYVK